MSKSILTIPPWVLFFSFCLGAIVIHFIALALAQYFGWSLDYGPYPTLRYALFTLLLWAYPYFVGLALSRTTGSRAIQQQMVLIVLVAIINNAFSVFFTETNGLVWYMILITILINIFCIVIVFTIPACELKSIELQRKAKLYEYWPEMIQFMIWPISVW